MDGGGGFDMKKFGKIVVAILIAVFAVNAQTKYQKYANDRFAYSIEYPSGLLKMQAPPANNDGRTFRSNDGKIEMRVWGQHNALERNLVEEYDESVKKCGTSSVYKDFYERYFVISCTVNNRIYYQKTLHRGESGPEIFFTFTIEYPTSQKAKMDAVVTRISRSFKFDPDADI